VFQAGIPFALEYVTNGSLLHYFTLEEGAGKFTRCDSRIYRIAIV
jgi:hypothetical protein